jgi:prepilin-type N-terminal cleavage/methylation domain-containing protein/prepilin-type processing-associated H-X9-DG protein
LVEEEVTPIFPLSLFGLQALFCLSRREYSMNRMVLRCGMTLVELLIVLGILGVLMSLVLSAALKVREAAHRTSCANHLKQLGLALHLYHDSNGCFPPGATVRPRRHRWAQFLLPYLDQQLLGRQYRWDLNWYDGMNREVVMVPLEVMQCPSAPAHRVDLGTPGGADLPVACGDYAAVAFVQSELLQSGLIPPPLNPQGVLSLHTRTRLTDIRDGTSSTLVLTEAAGRPECWRYNWVLSADRSQGGGWADPENVLRILGSSPDGTQGPGPCAINCTNDEVYSFHPGGANGAFADGSVHFLGQSIPIATVAALVTLAGGEILQGTDF